jgi:hypothetical protein
MWSLVQVTIPPTLDTSQRQPLVYEAFFFLREFLALQTKWE